MQTSDLVVPFSSVVALCEEKLESTSYLVSEDLSKLGRFVLGMEGRSVKDIASGAKKAFSKKQQSEMRELLRATGKITKTARGGSLSGLIKEVGNLAGISVRRVLMDNAAIPDDPPVLRNNKIDNKDLMTMLYYWASMTSISYETKAFMLRYLRYAKDEENFFLFNERVGELSDFEYPKCFVYADRISKTVIVCIQGTENLADVFVDLIQKPKTFSWLPGIKFHGGFLKAAVNIINQTDSTIVSLLESNPDYSLKYIGHSYGAAVATLCSFIKYERTGYHGRDNRAITFACPAITDKKGLEAMCSVPGGLNVNFVLGWDVVPRITVKSISDLVCGAISDVEAMYTAPNTYWMIYDDDGVVTGVYLTPADSKGMTHLYYGEEDGESTMEDHSIARIKIALFAYIRVLQDKERSVLSVIKTYLRDLDKVSLDSLAASLNSRYAETILGSLQEKLSFPLPNIEVYEQVIYDYKRITVIASLLKYIAAATKDESRYLAVLNNLGGLKTAVKERKAEFIDSQKPTDPDPKKNKEEAKKFGREMAKARLNIQEKYNLFLSEFLKRETLSSVAALEELQGIAYDVEHSLVPAVRSYQDSVRGFQIDEEQGYSEESLTVLIQTTKERISSIEAQGNTIKNGLKSLDSTLRQIRGRVRNEASLELFQTVDKETHKWASTFEQSYERYRKVVKGRVLKQLSTLSLKNQQITAGIKEVKRGLDKVNLGNHRLTKQIISVSHRSGLSEQNVMVLTRQLNENVALLNSIKEYVSKIDVGYEGTRSSLGITIRGMIRRIDTLDKQQKAQEKRIKDLRW